MKSFCWFFFSVKNEKKKENCVQRHLVSGMNSKYFFLLKFCLFISYIGTLHFHKLKLKLNTRNTIGVVSLNDVKFHPVNVFKTISCVNVGVKT